MAHGCFLAVSERFCIYCSTITPYSSGYFSDWDCSITARSLGGKPMKRALALASSRAPRSRACSGWPSNGCEFTPPVPAVSLVVGEAGVESDGLLAFPSPGCGE